MILMIISIAITGLSSLLFLSLLRPCTKPAALIGWYVLGFSQIVLVEEIAHFFNGLNKPGNILLIQAAFLAAAAGLWLAAKRPKIGGVLYSKTITGEPNLLKDLFHGHLENIILGAVTSVGYAYAFFLGWMVAPNTYDAITTHAVRVVYWLQHGNLLPWNAVRYTQVSYPMNAQLQLLWSAQFLQSDRLFFTAQWLAGIITILCVFGLARLLNFSRPRSLFAGMVFANFPLIWMQSSTAQNDLVAAAVFLPVVYFFMLGFLRRKTSMLILSGIALGLSLGTKQTLFFYLPGLALLAGLVWVKYGGGITKYILRWAEASLAGVVLLSAFVYIQNYIYFGNPLAPAEAVESAVGGTAPEGAIGNITYNSLRLLYQSVDNSGLPDPAGDFLTRAKNKSIGSVLRFLNPDLESSRFTATTHTFNYRTPNVLSEDASWFGPVGGILLIPLALFQAWQGVRKKDPWRIGVVITVVLFWLLDAWLRPGWDPYQGRYFIPAAGLMAPFLAVIKKPGWLNRSASVLITAVSVFVLGFTAIFNPGKSAIPHLEDAWSIKANFGMLFKLDWIDQVTLQTTGITPLARLVDDNVPQNAAIGWYGFTAPEYPIFGEQLSRRIIPITPPSLIHDRGWLSSQQLKYILVDWNKLDGKAPEDYRELASVFNWLLLVRK